MKIAKGSPKGVENTVGKKEKLLIMRNFSLSHGVFKRLVLQTRKNRGLFGKWLIYNGGQFKVKAVTSHTDSGNNVYQI